MVGVKWIGDGADFDEVFDQNGLAREHYLGIVDALGNLTQKEIKRRGDLLGVMLRNQGITFNVYGEKEAEERVFPFDYVPRLIPPEEWAFLEKGLVQRVTALNLFLLDVYTTQRAMKEGVVPYELVLSRPEYLRELLGVVPPGKIFTHVIGTDLVRDQDGQYLVLEDNCRSPSGVSYVIENRNLLRRTFPELFGQYPVRPVLNYPAMLLDTLGFVAPRRGQPGSAVVLTPGRYNSAYFEHSFLAREMGVYLVEGSDLVVDENIVYVKTTEGRQPVDVIYRRIDDKFLDPLAFSRDSMLGVPGLINAYRAGNVALANAPGAGVADDKAVYAFVPDLIRFYLGEEPILHQVPTYSGHRPEDLAYILDNLPTLVVKETGGAGGYGMLMGPFATSEEIAAFRRKIKAKPAEYVAQPLVEISSHPTYIDGAYHSRRVDLRPFILYGDRVRVLPGGLTRVALRKGSYVVNSSQGGGSKDTWVLDDKNHPKEVR